MYRSTLLILAFVIVTVVSVAAEGAVVTITAKKVLVGKRTPNGSEQRVPAVEFTVTSSEKFEPRALEPVLFVGKLDIFEYRSGNTGYTLIFTCYEPDKLEDNVPMFVEYVSDFRQPRKADFFRTQSALDKLPRFRLSMIEPL
jgi:hypothetical protein